MMKKYQEARTMAKAKMTKQISFMMPNKVGLLAEVSSALTKAKVNITAICAYEMDNQATFMLIVDSNARAKKALSPLGAEIKEGDVMAIEISNKLGELQKVSQKIAAVGIDIYYMYGTAGAGKSPICVFATSDDKKALKVINR